MRLLGLTEIKRLRKDLGITQSELAEKASVSQSLIARLEAGTVDPRYSKVERICKALDELKKREITAKELMTSKVVGVQLTDSMEDTVRIMSRFKVSQIPVFNKKKVAGSISEKRILNEIGKGANMKDFSHRNVADFMEHPFPIVNNTTSLTTLSKLLEHNTAILVMEGGDIKGIITNADLLKVVRR
ncbi:MAG: CBS domain-containing protein [Candidatus Altiarchaeota archaeon]|nr:CBS domain-containing protein [Candidatus Altiarchaeota archaeon]